MSGYNRSCSRADSSIVLAAQCAAALSMMPASAPSCWAQGVTAGRLLCAGGLLVLYGPFMRDGVHNAPSNAAFDASLKARNPSWGVRDIADLERVGEASGLSLHETIEMPANNMSLVFSNGCR